MAARTILVVDDEPTVADLVGVVLEPEGVHVVPARDGAEAIRAAERERFDVIVLDVMMPEVDGVEVCRILRGELGQEDPRIILCSAADESAVAWREAGADAFLAKPFEIKRLCRLIDDLTGDGADSGEDDLSRRRGPPARHAPRSSGGSPRP